MSFLFGLFRFLSWGNIVVVGFFLLFLVMSLIVSPAILSVLTSLFFLGAVMYHNIQSTQLQSAISYPSRQLPPHFPRTFLISGIVSFVYALLVAVNLIIFSRLGEDELMKLMNTSNVKESDGVTVEQLVGIVRKMVLIFGGIHAAAIAINCELSRIFFNRWRKDKQEKEEDTSDFFDINNPE